MAKIEGRLDNNLTDDNTEKRKQKLKMPIISRLSITITLYKGKRQTLVHTLLSENYNQVYQISQL